MPIEIIFIALIGAVIMFCNFLEFVFLAITRKGRLILKSRWTSEYVDLGGNYLVRCRGDGSHSFKVKPEIIREAMVDFKNSRK